MSRGGPGEARLAQPGTGRGTFLWLWPAALSGLLLFLADFPLSLWPLQAFALLPLLAVLRRTSLTLAGAALAGVTTGVFFLAPLACVLQLPWLVALALATYQALLWGLLAAVARGVLAWPAPLGGLAAGATAAVIGWIDFTVIPVWGTAQSFVRSLAAAPATIQIAALAGMTGIIFVLVAVQALALLVLAQREGRRRNFAALALLLAAVVGYSISEWDRAPDGTVRVAAIGWTEESLERVGSRSAKGVLDHVYRPLLDKAIAAGASLVVSPEVGFVLAATERRAVLDELGALARRGRAMLAVGYFDLERNDNRLAFIDEDGVVRGEYVKSKLIPGFESYRAGPGEPVVVRHGGLEIGGLICHDDNFTRLPRAYGRALVQLVAVPTNDWQQVKDHHLASASFRAVENRFGVVRAASNGISAIVSPRGEALAQADHFGQGATAIVADLPLRRGSVTVYALAGDWFPAVAFALLTGFWGWRRWRQI